MIYFWYPYILYQYIWSGIFFFQISEPRQVTGSCYEFNQMFRPSWLSAFSHWILLSHGFLFCCLQYNFVSGANWYKISHYPKMNLRWLTSLASWLTPVIIGWFDLLNNLTLGSGNQSRDCEFRSQGLRFFLFSHISEGLVTTTCRFVLDTL